MAGAYGQDQGKVWGALEYVALDVQLEDGSSRLFWHYVLEEVPER